MVFWVLLILFGVWGIRVWVCVLIDGLWLMLSGGSFRFVFCLVIELVCLYFWFWFEGFVICGCIDGLPFGFRVRVCFLLVDSRV